MPIFLFRVGFFEIFVVLVVLFTIFVLPIILGLTVYFAINKNQKAKKAWKAFADEAGLFCDKLTIKGRYNGSDIEFSLRKETRAGGEGSSQITLYTSCMCRFDTPLRMQLVISSTKFSNYFSVKRKFNIGDAEFDRAYTANCYDPAVVKKLLTAPFPSRSAANLMQDLMIAYSEIGKVMVNDKCVYVEVYDVVTDKNVLRNMAETASELHRRFADARRVFPLVQWEKDLLATYNSLANDYGFTVDNSRFSATGNFQRMPIEIELTSTNEKLKTVITAKFEKNLQAGFRLITANAITSAITLLGFQDIVVGHNEFDDTFVVKGKDAMYVRQMLSQDVCGVILGLKKNTQAIEIDDAGIKLEFSTVLTDANTIKSYLQAVANISAKIGR